MRNTIRKFVMKQKHPATPRFFIATEYGNFTFLTLADAVRMAGALNATHILDTESPQYKRYVENKS